MRGLLDLQTDAIFSWTGQLVKAAAVIRQTGRRSLCAQQFALRPDHRSSMLLQCQLNRNGCAAERGSAHSKADRERPTRATPGDNALCAGSRGVGEVPPRPLRLCAFITRARCMPRPPQVCSAADAAIFSALRHRLRSGVGSGGGLRRPSSRCSGPAGGTPQASIFSDALGHPLLRVCAHAAQHSDARDIAAFDLMLEHQHCHAQMRDLPGAIYGWGRESPASQPVMYCVMHE